MGVGGERKRGQGWEKKEGVEREWEKGKRRGSFVPTAVFKSRRRQVNGRAEARVGKRRD